MEYRYVATSIEGFIQQLAVAYITHGYWFYVSGMIPDTKCPNQVDHKLLNRYGIPMSRWARARRKRQGLANLHYLRFERTFILIATHGQHDFFVEESAAIRDIRRVPFKHSGYAISYRNGHASVRIDREMYAELKAYLTDLASRRTAERMSEEFRLLPIEPYAPVRRQLLNLHRAVNRVRKQSGYAQIPVDSLQLKRRIFRPFASDS